MGWTEGKGSLVARVARGICPSRGHRGREVVAGGVQVNGQVARKARAFPLETRHTKPMTVPARSLATLGMFEPSQLQTRRSREQP